MVGHVDVKCIGYGILVGKSEEIIAPETDRT
jgi:hypothetical protein